MTRALAIAGLALVAGAAIGAIALNAMAEAAANGLLVLLPPT